MIGIEQLRRREKQDRRCVNGTCPHELRRGVLVADLIRAEGPHTYEHIERGKRPYPL